jgi:hypothetical protein
MSHRICTDPVGYRLCTDVKDLMALKRILTDLIRLEMSNELSRKRIGGVEVDRVRLGNGGTRQLTL